MDAYINVENNHLILIYENGETVDTNITLNCESDIEKYLPPYSRVCLPKYRNSFIYNIQNIPGHFIISYTSSDNCDMGQLCETRLIIFSQTEPTTDCACPFDGHIAYVNTSNGNVYIKEIDSDIYLYIGNTCIETIGPIGLNVNNVVYTNNSIYTHFANNTFIQTQSIYGPTGPTGPINEYTGTGVFGQFNAPTSMNQAIDLLRQPYTFYPTFFGTGIGSDIDSTPAQDAIVLGNHNDMTGPNNADYAIAIGYHSGQINQQSDAVAIGKTCGYNSQGTGSIAIGNQAGYINQGQYSIAIGNQACVTNQADNSIVLSAGGVAVDNTIPNSCVVYPIRNVNGTMSTRLYWDPVTYEMTYGTESSSIRYKDNVIKLPQRYIESIYELNPVEFTLKTSPNKRQVGLIAEQVDEILPEIVIRNIENRIEGIDYQQLIAPMIEILKDYKLRLNQIENNINKHLKYL